MSRYVSVRTMCSVRLYPGTYHPPAMFAGMRTVASSAPRYNPDVRALYRRLLACGKPQKLALAACMHTLLRIASGVLTHHTLFQPHTA